MPSPVCKCNLCGKETPRKSAVSCRGCSKVHYCSKVHLENDRQHHALACGYARSWQQDVPADQYVGTFAWSNTTDFPPLPPYRSAGPLLGWQEYFSGRLDGGGDGDGSAVTLQVTMIDGLSFALSLLYGVSQCAQKSPDIKEALLGAATKHLVVVAVGCSERAEEHVLRHSNYFDEIGHYMPRRTVQLWLVGPEMSRLGHRQQRQLTPSMTAACFRGSTSDFFKEHPDLLRLGSPRPDEGREAAAGAGCGTAAVVIGFNTGMASGDQRLRASWATDVRLLLSSGLLAIFTCANDHSDVKCERELMEKELDARYVLYPRRNPFAAVTVLHPPGERTTAWYTANAFTYAVQGYARQQPQPQSPPVPQVSPRVTVPPCPSGRPEAAPVHAPVAAAAAAPEPAAGHVGTIAAGAAAPETGVGGQLVAQTQSEGNSDVNHDARPTPAAAAAATGTAATSLSPGTGAATFAAPSAGQACQAASASHAMTAQPAAPAATSQPPLLQPAAAGFRVPGAGGSTPPGPLVKAPGVEPQADRLQEPHGHLAEVAVHHCCTSGPANARLGAACVEAAVAELATRDLYLPD